MFIAVCVIRLITRPVCVDKFFSCVPFPFTFGNAVISSKPCGKCSFCYAHSHFFNKILFRLRINSNQMTAFAFTEFFCLNPVEAVHIILISMSTRFFNFYWFEVNILLINLKNLCICVIFVVYLKISSVICIISRNINSFFCITFRNYGISRTCPYKIPPLII